MESKQAVLHQITSIDRQLEQLANDCGYDLNSFYANLLLHSLETLHIAEQLTAQKTDLLKQLWSLQAKELGFNNLFLFTR